MNAGQIIELAAFLRRNATMGTSERYRTAVHAELYYLSKQYEDKSDWHDKSVPLRERKPRIVVPLFRETIEAVDRFLWSGHRFPKAVVGATRDADGEGDDEIGPLIDPEQAGLLTEFVAKLVKLGRLDGAIREATTKCLTTTSAAVFLGVQAGYLCAFVQSGKDCTPTFDPKNPRQLEQIEVKYQYQREVPKRFGPGIEKRWFWYRRVVDSQRDVTYLEVEVVPGRSEPEWEEDSDKTINHGLGFVPAVWLRSFPDSSDQVDGCPLIDPALYPMLDSISYTVSQRQRAIEYGLDPQPWRRGVPVGDREQLQKTPGKTWELPESAEVGFLEAQGTGADKAGDHLQDLTTAFRAAVGVVEATPEINAHQVSGVALALLYAPMIALASDLRVDLGDHGYCTVLAMALRIVTTVVQDKGEDVWIPGVKKATAMLKAAQLGGVWLDPPIDLEWQPFFQESEQDRTARVTYTQAAKDAKLISSHTATRHVAEVFSINDPAAEHEAIDEEADEAAERAAQVAPPVTEKPAPGAQVAAPEDAAEQQVE